jgi:hypothetical protein
VRLADAFRFTGFLLASTCLLPRAASRLALPRELKRQHED